MIELAILAGGDSNEREVSIRSGQAVARALENHCSITTYDPIGGVEHYLNELAQVDAVFIALHGRHGEDGNTQRILETHAIPFTGSTSTVSELCFNKVQYAESLTNKSILVPQMEYCTYSEFLTSELRSRPFVVKPCKGGSSIDTFIVRDPHAYDSQVLAAAFATYEKMIVQELINGIEITVPILGTSVLPVIEIIPPSDEEFDYDNKYNGRTLELCPPRNLPVALQANAQDLALQIHHLLGCRDLSRTDMIASDNNLYVLETNTIPGLSNQSLLPKSAAVAGLSMTEVCMQLVKASLERV